MNNNYIFQNNYKAVIVLCICKSNARPNSRQLNTHRGKKVE